MSEKNTYGAAWALYSIGRNYYSLNDLDNAEKYYSKAITKEPLAWFVETRAELYIETNEYEKAIIDLEKAKSLSIQQNELWNICSIGTQVAILHYKQNELIKALYVIDEVINVEKNRLKSGGKVGSLTHAHIFRHTVFKRLKEDELACNELKEIYKLYTTMLSLIHI